MSPVAVLDPRGWAYVGCRGCGLVTTVPAERADPPPFCVHNGGTVVWDEALDPGPAPSDWTRMVRVAVAWPRRRRQPRPSRNE